MTLAFLKRTSANPDVVSAAAGKAWLAMSAIQDGDEVLVAANAVTEVARWNVGGCITASQAIYNTAARDFCFNTPAQSAADAPAWITATQGGGGEQPGTYRLRYVNTQTNATLASITGTANKYFNSATHAAIFITSLAAMQTAFNIAAVDGKVNSNGAAETAPLVANRAWVLESIGSGGATARKLKSQLTDADRILSNDLHAATPVDWRARNAAATPAPGTYTELYRWNVSGGSGNFQSRNGDYYTQGTGAGIYDGGLFVNRYPAPDGNFITSSTMNGLLNDGNTYRLRVVGNAGGVNGLPAGKNGIVTGAITTVLLQQNRFGFIVESAASMRTAFGDPPVGGGAFGLYQGGGQWILERQN